MAFSAEDIVPDSPTNNFATFNVLTEPNITTGNTFSDGNLKLAFSTTAGVFPSLLGSIAIPNDTGVWYWEVHYTTTTFNSGFGIYNENTGLTTDYGGSQANLTDAGFVLFNGSSLKKVYLNTITEIANSLSSPIIFQLIFDAVNRKLFIKYNDTEPSGQSISSGTSLFPVFSAGKTYIPAFYHGDGGSGTKSGTMIINHGQDPTFGGASNLPTGAGDYDTDAAGASTGGRFAYQPPAGAKALCTANLPDFTPTVTGDVPQDYFKTVIWTGTESTGSSDANTINVGHQPDFIWIKARNAAYSHYLFDSVRGLSSGNWLVSDSTNVEETSAIQQFNITSTGIDLLTGYNATNNLNTTYVGFFWKAGGAPSGSTSTTGSAKRINTSGTQDDTSCSALATAATNAGASNVITPTLMSINQAAGFSIVSYTGNNVNGATIPHGLNNPPEIIITKNRSITSEWPVAYVPTSTSGYLNHPYNFATANFNDQFVTAPTSTVFSAGTIAGYVNSNSNNHIAYCWHSVENYSKCGSYVGNGSPDGPFVYCGFRPAWVMVKRTNATAAWVIQDDARSPYNVVDAHLLANAPNDESSGLLIDYLSNGFKIRVDNTYTDYNATNGSFIFMAFAEQPFKYSNAR